MPVNLLEDARRDARHALRSARRSPGFACAAVLTLALGVGANSAIFSLVHAILIRPLPYPHADRLVRIVEHVPAEESIARRPERIAALAIDDFFEWRTRTKALARIGLHADASMTLIGRDANVRLRGARVSPAVFPMLGLEPAIGRVFSAGEERRAADAVVILSERTWRRHFAGDRAVVGRTLTLDGRDYTVIGVMSARCEFPDAHTEFWIPFVPADPQVGRIIRAPAIARLADGVTLQAAMQEINAIDAALRQGARDARAPRSAPAAPAAGGAVPTAAVAASGQRFEVVGVQEQLVAPVRPALLALVAAVSAVLLIACANVANLLLARSAIRGREMAIRGALGASRARLIRQALTESLVLAVAGGATGLALAAAGVRLVVALATIDAPRWLAAGTASILPRIDDVAIDGPVLAFTAAAACVTGLLCGLAPAILVARGDYVGVMSGVAGSSSWLASRSASSSSSSIWRGLRPRASDLLVVAQLALATVLLVGAGLLIRSFVNLSHVDAGYDPANVVTFQAVLPSSRDPDDPHRSRFAERIVQRIERLPDVRFAGFTSVLPLTTARWMLSFSIPGISADALRQSGAPQTRYVSRDYLRAMGVRLLEGRWFGERDHAGEGRVLLINRALARRFFRDASTVGTFVTLNGDAWEIVGVVDDVRQGGLETEADALWFIDYRQVTAALPSVPVAGGVFFVVRTGGPPRAVLPGIRGIVRELEPRAVLDGVYEMEQLVSGALARPRFYAVLPGLFACLAGALAACGIAGVVACGVARRTREIGIRMALGAQRRQVVTLVLGQGAVLILAGITLGVGGAAALTRSLSALLFGLAPLDPLTFAAVPAGFAMVALLAAWVPARRAATVDPLVALSNEP